ncbi:hypothetical protein FRC01_010139 [Tulasnella sp. 417]|nr:hypothetical protein FRC01_010139 [Tulasnella sp. 417]
MSFPLETRRYGFAVAGSMQLSAQALESARRLLGIPELLALVLENFPMDYSLVHAACVSRAWGELATAANWQRRWIDVRKLILMMPPNNFYMTVRFLHGEIEAGALIGYKTHPSEAPEDVKERFLLYCSKVVNISLLMGVEEGAMNQLKEAFPQNVPFLPRLKRVYAENQGDWTATAPAFLGPSIHSLKMALRHPSDQNLPVLQEFRNIRSLHLTHRERDRRIDFGKLENLHTLVADEVERASSFWDNLSESKTLRDVEIRSTDGWVPEWRLQYHSLQHLSLPAKDFILWTSTARAMPIPDPPTHIDNISLSHSSPSYTHGVQPTFPALRSLTLLQEARPLGIHLVKLVNVLKHHAPQLKELNCGHGRSYPFPEAKAISRPQFRGHFKSETTRVQPLNALIENGEQLGDDDFIEVTPGLGRIEEIRLTSSKSVETLTPNALITLARHAKSLNVLKLRVTVKEGLEVSSLPIESFVKLRDVDVHFDGGGGSVIPCAYMLAHMCSSAILERFSVTSTS